jgi:cytochrome oxidase Cu insertion factor (SCO1/SenC/PrrC family)
MLRLATVALSTQSVFGFAVGAGVSASAARHSTKSLKMAALADFELTSITGDKVDMASLKGKPVLILNVASL